MQQAWLGNIGSAELLIILVIVLILFGAGKLPQVGASIGKAFRNLRGELKRGDDSK
jgi:sec-independent protein translocase protein TatA